jgi:hypothetical protein
MSDDGRYICTSCWFQGCDPESGSGRPCNVERCDCNCKTECLRVQETA